MKSASRDIHSAKMCPLSDLYLTEKSSYEHSGNTFT